MQQYMTDNEKILQDGWIFSCQLVLLYQNLIHLQMTKKLGSITKTSSCGLFKVILVELGPCVT